MRLGKTSRHIAYLTVIAIICAAFLTITYLGWFQKEQRIQHLMQLSLLIGVAAIYLRRNRLNGKDWLVVAMLYAGIVIRIGYSLYTPTTLRFHDLAPIDSRATGHAGYVLNLFEYGALPPSNAFQYAQPPFYYIVAAFFMKLYQWLSGLTNSVELFEAVRLPSCLASCAALLIGNRIAGELRLSRGATRAAVGVCAFLPNHFLLAGRANPDGMAVFFIFCCVWFALRWYRTQTIRNTVFLALSFGFGMMTKMTVAVLAVPVGILMASILLKRCREHNAWPMVRQLMLFLLIAVPLGLWHPVRNAILYGQSLTNIHMMSLTDPQYIGNLSIARRYGLFNPIELFSPLYLNWETGNNVILYTLKSSVFGEFSYRIDAAIPMMLLIANTALIVLSLIATVRVGLWALRKHDVPWLLLLGVWITALVAYLLFTLQYPFCCSMDYRYMVVTSLVGALMLGKMFETAGNVSKFNRLYAAFTRWGLIVFAAASTVMYCNIA